MSRNRKMETIVRYVTRGIVVMLFLTLIGACVYVLYRAVPGL